MTIYNQFRIRRLYKCRNRSCEHWTRHRPITGKPLISSHLWDNGHQNIGGQSRSWDFWVTWHQQTSLELMPFPIRGQSEPSIYLKPFLRYWPLSVLRSRPWLLRVTERFQSYDHSIPRYRGPGSHGANGAVGLAPWLTQFFCSVAPCSPNIWTTSWVSIKPFWDNHFWVSYVTFIYALSKLDCGWQLKIAA